MRGEFLSSDMFNFTGRVLGWLDCLPVVKPWRGPEANSST